MDPESWKQNLEGTTQSGTMPGGDSKRADLFGLTLLGHPDLSRVGEVAPLPGLLSGKIEHLSRLAPLFASRQGDAPRPLADNRISRQPICLSAAADGGLLLEEHEVQPSLQVNGRRVDGDGIQLSRPQLQSGVVLLLANRVALVLHTLEIAARHLPRYSLVGESAGIQRVRQEIQRIADVPLPVLLRGESGTGKELVARAIHASGLRRTRPYLAINLGAVPPALAAAELFGASRGAFTGADRSRPGYFQRVEGGTLFLDEIGEATSETQALLLRTLDTGEIQPVGDARPHRVDVRWIAATDADLETAAAGGGFKTPLLHRLGGYEIRLPPLRERREDVGRLFLHFLGQESEILGDGDPGKRHGHAARPWIPAELLSRLALFDWPGNVRQLRNVVRRLVIGSRGREEVQVPDDLEGLLAGTSGPADRPNTAKLPSSDHYRDPDDVGRAELHAALRRTRWNLKQAAVHLQISRGALYELVQRDPQLRKASDLSREEVEESLAKCGGSLEAMVEHFQVSKRGLKLRLTALGLRNRLP